LIDAQEAQAACALKYMRCAAPCTQKPAKLQRNSLDTRPLKVRQPSGPVVPPLVPPAVLVAGAGGEGALAAGGDAGVVGAGCGDRAEEAPGWPAAGGSPNSVSQVRGGLPALGVPGAAGGPCCKAALVLRGGGLLPAGLRVDRLDVTPLSCPASCWAETEPRPPPLGGAGEAPPAFCEPAGVAVPPSCWNSGCSSCCWEVGPAAGSAWGAPAAALAGSAAVLVPLRPLAQLQRLQDWAQKLTIQASPHLPQAACGQVRAMEEVARGGRREEMDATADT